MADHQASPSQAEHPIDPALQVEQPTLNSVSAAINPLNEFAQQVLGREHAENLLDFGRGPSILGEEQTFGDLLQEERRRDGEGDDGVGSGDERHHGHHAHHEHHDEHQHHEHNHDGLEHQHAEHMAAGPEGQGAHLAGDGAAIDGHGSTPGARPNARPPRASKRKRVNDVTVLDENGQPMEPQEYVRNKKENHKEVERRRRDAITAGIDEIASLLPSGIQKEGKSLILKRAVAFIAEAIPKLSREDGHDQGDAEKEQLRMEIAHLEGRLAEEHARSLRFESSWRQAEDLSASSGFELERVKAELEELKAANAAK
ncbi:hypothetical protein IAT38_005178 [Cryptococcus sp. DSM 104549]